jgi:hypothetical protein
MFYRKTTTDPIVALESLGYTEREASFLYLVALHSGYLLRRQFCRFIERKKGWIAQRFIEKARVAGHIEIIDYGQGKYVYHLLAKPIYRLFGNEESQNRHRKGDSEIRARLMALDYLLENRSEHFLETPQDKIEFFLNVRGVPSALVAGRGGQLHSFLSHFPISVVDHTQPTTSVVRFAFLDEGLLSMSKFSRFLSELRPLMLAVRAFEVIYTATSSINFRAAEGIFRKTFEPSIGSRQQTFEEIAFHPRQDWPSSSPLLLARFTRLLFHFSYPQLLRNEPRESEGRSAAQSASMGVTA